MDASPEALKAGLKNVQLSWAGNLTGVLLVAGSMYYITRNQLIAARPGFDSWLWWAPIVLPVIPAVLLIQRMRKTEAAYARGEADVAALLQAYALAGLLTGFPALAGAPLGMVSGKMEFIAISLPIALALVFGSRPDRSRHV